MVTEAEKDAALQKAIDGMCKARGELDEWLRVAIHQEPCKVESATRLLFELNDIVQECRRVIAATPESRPHA